MVPGLAVLLLAVVLSVVVGLLLYALVRGEHDQRPIVDREEAERLARRDASDGDE